MNDIENDAVWVLTLSSAVPEGIFRTLEEAMRAGDDLPNKYKRIVTILPWNKPKGNGSLVLRRVKFQDGHQGGMSITRFQLDSIDGNCWRQHLCAQNQRELDQRRQKRMERKMRARA